MLLHCWAGKKDARIATSLRSSRRHAGARRPCRIATPSAPSGMARNDGIATTHFLSKHKIRMLKKRALGTLRRRYQPWHWSRSVGTPYSGPGVRAAGRGPYPHATRPERPVPLGDPAGRRYECGWLIGSVKVKVEPLPTSDWTQILPPWARRWACRRPGRSPIYT